jgi:N-acetylglucosaminyldiphosphoundecaprenol N-acetyl-beta-D-mannosaminyltransferase
MPYTLVPFRAPTAHYDTRLRVSIEGPAPTPIGARALVLDCAIDRLDMEQTVARCRAAIDRGASAEHVSINAAKVVAMRDDPRLQGVIAESELVTADGQSVVWASRLLGDPLPARVAGIDLMHRLLEVAEESGYRVFILGAKRPVLEAAIVRIRARHPRLEIAGYRDGYFPEADEGAVAAGIAAVHPDILFVAISSPRKEYFLGKYRDELGVPLVMGVGGAIDVVAGVTRRAPRAMQRLGLEWLFRLTQEPRRLMARYLVTNARFLLLLGRAVAIRRIRR